MHIQMRKLLTIAVVALMAAMTLISCSNDDNVIVEPTGQVLQDGEWMGTGEGRSGSIVVKVVVKNHQVELVTVVSQSESVFAQETINSIVAAAQGRTDVMSVEVDGISGATLTSTGVIGAINAALQAAMGKAPDAEKTYKDGTCDIVVVGAGGAGLSADRFAQAVSRYNAQQKAGLDDDFGRSATGMPVALETPPFYAVRVKPAIHHTMGGLSVNT